MELRLHLNMEDLDAFLEDESVRAMQNLPGALQEVARLKVCFGTFRGIHLPQIPHAPLKLLVVQDDLTSLKVDVERVFRQLQSATAEVEQAVSPLVQLDHVKGRLEEACSTLKVCHSLCPTDAFEPRDWKLQLTVYARA